MVVWREFENRFQMTMAQTNQSFQSSETREIKFNIYPARMPQIPQMPHKQHADCRLPWNPSFSRSISLLFAIFVEVRNWMNCAFADRSTIIGVLLVGYTILIELDGAVDATVFSVCVSLAVLLVSEWMHSSIVSWLRGTFLKISMTFRCTRASSKNLLVAAFLCQNV